jgi:hypothetical protein
MLTTGLDRRAKLVSVTQGAPHKLVQSIFLEDLPIYKGQFINGGKQALFTGNRRHMYLFDLGAGRVEKLSGSLIGHEEEKNLS